ncbi:MAG: polyribonucleotide nucleotidyltransferase [Culicoidibacterales bacterium]
MAEKHVFSTEVGGRTLTVEIGQLAKQADGAVLVRYEDTVVLSTAVASKDAKDLDFFPLMVVYDERLYAAGKIPGGFIKREGRPSENAILAGRLIDRPIRPLFAEGFRNDVQIVNTVMSADIDNSPEMAAMFGSSLALTVSDIPFEGPIAGVKVGMIDDTFIVNPTREQMEKSEIDLTVAGTMDAINMVEAGANQVPEAVMLEAIMFGHAEIQKLIAFQNGIREQIGKPKRDVVLYEIPAEIQTTVTNLVGAQLVAAASIPGKQDRYAAIDALQAEVVAHYEALEADAKTFKQAKEFANEIVKNEVRRLITEDKVRPDGRQIDEVRSLAAETDLLPLTHGTALFTRGETQTLSIVTLGAAGEHQILDGLDGEETKRFMHHYNFPPFSVGETGRMGAPGRREIGHGALGERALSYVLPDETTFPYTIRVVSEVLESNGSTSQASICSSTMALMAAGVPIVAPVAGIAMGLISDGTNYSVLTDIQGLEDHLGDMDFKVAGTANGVTALQMDIKIKGITREILAEALAQAYKGRMHILETLVSTIAEPREDVAATAPKVEAMQIKVAQIRTVIGTGGKQINQIIDETGVKIDIEEDGRVFIYSDSREMINRAKQIIEDLTREVELNAIYEAKVVRIEKFGAFVELFPGKDALVHISQLAHERVEKTEDVVKLGDVVRVKVTEIDQQGRANASMKVLLPKPEAKPKTEETAKTKPE